MEVLHPDNFKTLSLTDCLEYAQQFSTNLSNYVLACQKQEQEVEEDVIRVLNWIMSVAHYLNTITKNAPTRVTTNTPSEVIIKDTRAMKQQGLPQKSIDVTQFCGNIPWQRANLFARSSGRVINNRVVENLTFKLAEQQKVMSFKKLCSELRQYESQLNSAVHPKNLRLVIQTLAIQGCLRLENQDTIYWVGNTHE